MTREDIPSDLRIYGITNKIFRTWQSDVSLRDKKRKEVIRRFMSVDLVLKYDQKEKVDDRISIKSIVSLDWQKASTFMVVKDLARFNEWLTQLAEISVDDLKSLDEKDFLDSKTEMPIMIGQNPQSENEQLRISNFKIIETLKVPQILYRLFSDKQAFRHFKVFLSQLKRNRRGSAREIIDYVLSLELMEKRLGDFHNVFKGRGKLKERDILLNRIRKKEDYEEMRLCQIKKTQSHQPNKAGKSEFRKLIHKISNAPLKPAIANRLQKSHQSQKKCRPKPPRNLKFNIKSKRRIKTKPTSPGKGDSPRRAHEAPPVRKTPESRFSPNASGQSPSKGEDQLADDIGENLREEKSQIVMVDNMRLNPQMLSLRANVGGRVTTQMKLEKAEKEMFFIRKEKLSGLIESTEKKITLDMLSIDSCDR